MNNQTRLLALIWSFYFLFLSADRVAVSCLECTQVQVGRGDATCDVLLFLYRWEEKGVKIWALGEHLPSQFDRFRCQEAWHLASESQA